MDWQPIETAPKDGTIILTYWRDHPVLAAWENDGEREGFWVLMFTRGGAGYSLHGNYAPYIPTHWLPVPEYPQQV